MDDFVLSNYVPILEAVIRRFLKVVMDDPHRRVSRRNSPSAIQFGLDDLLALKTLFQDKSLSKLTMDVNGWIKSVSLTSPSDSSKVPIKHGITSDIDEVDFLTGWFLDEKTICKVLELHGERRTTGDTISGRDNYGETVRVMVENALRASANYTQKKRWRDLSLASIFVFGSAASGLNGTDSDVDLMLHPGQPSIPEVTYSHNEDSVCVTSDAAEDYEFIRKMTYELLGVIKSPPFKLSKRKNFDSNIFSSILKCGMSVLKVFEEVLSGQSIGLKRAPKTKTPHWKIKAPQAEVDYLRLASKSLKR